MESVLAQEQHDQATENWILCLLIKMHSKISCIVCPTCYFLDKLVDITHTEIVQLLYFLNFLKYR